MDTRDFLLMAYKAFGGSIQGKTKLQKLIYFIAVFQNQVEKLGYIPHYYGPYSPIIANENAILSSLGFISEEIVHTPLINENGFEITRYDFKLSAAGERIVSEKIVQYENEWESIKEIAENVQKAGDLNYQELSIAAKSYYILSKKGSANRGLIQQMAKDEFGWEIETTEHEKAIKFLLDTKLVTEKK
jgi:uncharacterized protein